MLGYAWLTWNVVALIAGFLTMLPIGYVFWSKLGLKKRSAKMIGILFIVIGIFGMFGVWGMFGNFTGFSVACSNDVSPSLNYQAANSYNSDVHSGVGTTYIWADGTRVSDVTTPTSFGAGQDVIVAMTGNASVYGAYETYKIKCQNTDYLNLDIANCGTAATASWKNTAGTAATAVTLGAADNQVFTLTLQAPQDQCYGNPDSDNSQGLISCLTGNSAYYSSFEPVSAGHVVGLPYTSASNTTCIEWDRNSVCDGAWFEPQVRVKSVADVNATYPMEVSWRDGTLFLTQAGGIGWGVETDAATPADVGRASIGLTVTTL